MKCIDRLKQDAERMGATLEADEWTIYVDAKPGYVWGANRCSALSAAYRNTGGQQWAREACKDLREQMKYGLRKCDAEESAQIEYDRDENWTAAEDAPETISF